MSTFKQLCTALLIVSVGIASPLSLSAEEGGKEKEKERAKEEKHDAMPVGTKGVSQGEIVSKEKGKLVLKTKDGNLLFMAHWRGGMPKDGGGLDKEMLATLEHFKAGQQVKIGWVWEERRRIEKIEALK